MPKRFEDEWKTLIRGYEKFRHRYFSNNSNIFQKLAAHGQKPKTMIICCSDSRVDPAIIMSCSPGDIFVVRNVANLVPSFYDRLKNNSIGAALEFAVRYLGVENIIVLGHSHCGGIKALLESKNTSNKNEVSPEEAFILDWVKIADAAKDKVHITCKDLPLNQQAKICEQEALLLSLQNLKTYPWIRQKVLAGELSLHAWRFDINDGVIQSYNQASDKFEDLKPESQISETSNSNSKPISVLSKL